MQPDNIESVLPQPRRSSRYLVIGFQLRQSGSQFHGFRPGIYQKGQKLVVEALAPRDIGYRQFHCPSNDRTAAAWFNRRPFAVAVPLPQCCVCLRAP